MKYIKNFLLIFHIIIALAFVAQGNILPLLARTPVVLFIAGMWVNKFSKWYTIICGGLICYVAFTMGYVNAWVILDFLIGLFTIYYATDK